ncbi:SAM-dependent methyltransferase [Spirillospora sp. NPDC029432]|uniref:SAM-dependent methyltransferase n=1 Tax=Spirillospora sp. NPDC029432 TaxID=3154599 RepID=UPI0034571C00
MGIVLGIGGRDASRAGAGPSGDARPSAARVYDYHLGGKDNYAADRDLAERAVRRAPVISRLVRANRAFLRRVCLLLAAEDGIRQFVDIGCGLPARDNVDDVVRRADPSCRVAYVDNDPMVVSHARALLAAGGRCGAFEADLRDPGALLATPGLRRLIDFHRPVGVLLFGVLHFVTDAEDPAAVFAELLAGLPPGSRVAVSHAERTPALEAVAALYRDAGIPFTPRSAAELDEITRGLRPAGPPLGLAVAGGRPVLGASVPLLGRIGRTPG